MPSIFGARRSGLLTTGAIIGSIFLLFSYTQTDHGAQTYSQLSSHLPTPWQSSPATPCFDSIVHARTVLYDVYSEALSGVTHVAVLDWPWHHNSGDSAIWLGEVALLEALGKEISYICGIDDCVKEDIDQAMAHVPREKTAVLLHGGGNFGDIWPTHQNLRIRLVTELTDRKIVHFPQTFEFDLDRRSQVLQDSIDVYSKHPDLLMICRDTESLEMFKQTFLGVPVQLTPDAAFFIGYDQNSKLTPPMMRAPGSDMSILGLKGPYAASFDPSSPSSYAGLDPTDRSPFGWPGMSFDSAAEYDVLVLARYDKEGGQDRQAPEIWKGPLEPYTVSIRDWTDSWKGIKSPEKKNWGMIDDGAGGQTSFTDFWNQATLLRVQWAMMILSNGKIVVSDRLHTEIISTLLGLAHVAVENGHLRKMEKVINTWLSSCLIPMDEMSAIAAGAARKTDANTVFVHENEDAVKAARDWLQAEQKGIRWSRVSE